MVLIDVYHLCSYPHNCALFKPVVFNSDNPAPFSVILKVFVIIPCGVIYLPAEIEFHCAHIFTFPSNEYL